VLGIVKEVLRAVSEDAYMEEVFSSVVWSLRDHYKPQSCGIMLDENGLKVKVSRGLSYTYIKGLHSEGTHPLFELVRREGRLLVINQEHSHYPTGFEHPYRLMVLTPVRRFGQVAGLLFMDFAQEVQFSPEDIELFELLGYMLSVVYGYYLLEDRVDSLEEKDTLTGVYNFKKFHELLFTEVKRADETGHGFTLGLFAVTGLRMVNERYGHVAGDNLLKEVASLLEAEKRRFDVVARYSPAKFVVIMPESDKDFARRFAERVIGAFQRTQWEGKGVSLDVGIVAYPEDADNEKLLLNRLEECVVEARREKGHGIVVWPFR